MASTSAALNNRALVAAVCVVLLHSSMGQQPTPSSHCSPHTGQQPTPAPALAPIPTPPQAPTPTPTPSPAPTPVIDCHNQCTSDCNYNCSSSADAGISKCEADAVAGFNGCYASCTSQRCPGKSCEHSGCGFRNCTCDNPNASYCCQGCASAVSSAYFTCRSAYGGSYVYYCMLSCTSDCNNKCP